MGRMRTALKSAGLICERSAFDEFDRETVKTVNQSSGGSYTSLKDQAGLARGVNEKGMHFTPRSAWTNGRHS